MPIERQIGLLHAAPFGKLMDAATTARSISLVLIFNRLSVLAINNKFMGAFRANDLKIIRAVGVVFTGD